MYQASWNFQRGGDLGKKKCLDLTHPNSEISALSGLDTFTSQNKRYKIPCYMYMTSDYK